MQQEILKQLSIHFTNAQVKKIDADNYLDIHLPDVHTRRGTHLFFNTASGAIRLGFCCKDEEFVTRVLGSSNLVERYTYGLRPVGNPKYTSVEEAVEAAVDFVGILKMDAIALNKHADVNTEELTETSSEVGEEDERGYPLLTIRLADGVSREGAAKYLGKWQVPSQLYSGRMGITALVDESALEMTSDAICPLFTVKEIEFINEKVKIDKVIPVLSYVPEVLSSHSKHIWWIVPFCIWKDDVASYVFVDKNGFHALWYDHEEQEMEVKFIFSWDDLSYLEYEIEADDDPNVNRLTLQTDSGGHLTFDEFVTEGDDGDRGSYLSVIESIYLVRQKTIDASKDAGTWYEGAGGEGFKSFETPKGLLVDSEWEGAYRPNPAAFGYEEVEADEVPTAVIESTGESKAIKDQTVERDWDFLVSLAYFYIAFPMHIDDKLDTDQVVFEEISRALKEWLNGTAYTGQLNEITLIAFGYLDEDSNSTGAQMNIKKTVLQRAANMSSTLPIDVRMEILKDMARIAVSDGDLSKIEEKWLQEFGVAIGVIPT